MKIREADEPMGSKAAEAESRRTVVNIEPLRVRTIGPCASLRRDLDQHTCFQEIV
jgi:hypothetical protein